MATEQTTFETTIQNFLDNLAKEDSGFAKNYKKPEKSISECCKYIYQEMGKRRNGSNCVAASDEEVYGLAIHYYDEDDIKVTESKANVSVEAPATPPPAAGTVTKTTKPRTKKKKAIPEDPDMPEPLEIPLF